MDESAVAIDIDDDLSRRIDERAAELGVTRSELITASVEADLFQNTSGPGVDEL